MTQVDYSGQVGGFADTESPIFTDFYSLGERRTHVFHRARRFGRWYVLKSLRNEYRGVPFYEEWLHKEFVIGASLNHHGIVSVNSIEPVDGLGNSIVMEWIDGVTLDVWLKNRPRHAERRRVLSELFDAVEYCHRHGIFHHDLKPQNIMITADGNRVKLLDFGLSDGPQYASFKQGKGSEGFVAPEQKDGGKSDHRADIYALGRIIQLLFPHRYSHAVHRALSHDAAQRQQSVELLRRSLRPRWWLALLPLLFVAVLGVVYAFHQNRIYTTRLESGQTVYYRILQTVPQRRLALVSPGDADESWPRVGGLMQGKLVIPATLKHWGMNYKVVEVDDRAFQNQNLLTGLSLPEGLERIGFKAFSGCPGFKDTIVIPSTLRYIGTEAFSDCSGIAVLRWTADSCTMVKSALIPRCFYRCSSLRTIEVAPNVKMLPNQLFHDIDSLREIHFADGLVVIETDCFAMDSAVHSIQLPATLKSIGHAAFYKTRLYEIVIPDSLEVVGNYAFAYNNQVRRIVIGPNVKNIGSFAFADYYELEDVTTYAVTPPQIIENTFDAMPNTAVLRVPAVSLQDYRTHPIWGKFGSIEAIVE